MPRAPDIEHCPQLKGWGLVSNNLTVWGINELEFKTAMLRNFSCATRIRAVRETHRMKNVMLQSQAQGPWTDLALHTLGWKAFQDLCAHASEDILDRPVEIYREAQDGGQDAVFINKTKDGEAPATIQCKFSSQSGRHLKLSDLKKEEAHISELLKAGYADTYVLMTNMPASAPIAIQVKERLRELGVKHPHVFGREFLVRVIRSSPRLRALVPRIYGLGDLSSILDERRAAQARALLGHMLPTLKTYVTTEPHVKAVRALSKHKLVLLVGDPATGKSTIAAVLSTIAADNPNHRVFKAEGPNELLGNWNPHENGGFYWIDDAFGPNQLREDFVDQWVSMMPKIEAAIASGNMFVLTSRRHIYEVAKPKLGTRNHPLFRDGRAIVEVGSLTQAERRQILYNHIKYGEQTTHWKRQIKRELSFLSEEQLLTPEIARQLGDPSYTSNVTLTRESLLAFVRSNRTFLLQTIRELSKPHRAALSLVFLHRGRMPLGVPLVAMQELIMRHYDVDRETLADSIVQLKDSFLVEKTEGDRREWIFKHPTLADALAATLGEAEGMRELYLRGVKIDTILSDTLCDGMEPIPDAVIVPPTLNGLLIERLLEAEDDSGHLNRRLFGFLERRATDEVFRKIIIQNPSILARRAYVSFYLGYDPKVRTYARALSFGLLPSELRLKMAAQLEADLFEDLDTSILDDESVLGLFSPRQLLGMQARVVGELLTQIQSRAEEIQDKPDLDVSPKENFEDLESRLRGLGSFFADADESARDALAETEAVIEAAIEAVKEKKESRERRAAEEESYWEDYVVPPSSPIVVTPHHGLREAFIARSVFSDVDE